MINSVIKLDLHTLSWPKLWPNGSIIVPQPTTAPPRGYGLGYGATYAYPFGDGITYGNQQGNGVGYGFQPN